MTKTLTLLSSLLAFQASATDLAGNGSCPAMGGKIINRTTGEYIYLTAPMMGDMSDCSTPQIMYHMRNQTKSKGGERKVSLGYSDVPLTREFMEDNALEVIRELPFRKGEECPTRAPLIEKKDENGEIKEQVCLAPELEVSLIPKGRPRPNPRDATQNADVFFIPFNFTKTLAKDKFSVTTRLAKKVGSVTHRLAKKRFNEAILGGVVADATMYPSAAVVDGVAYAAAVVADGVFFIPNIIIHGVQASMIAARKAKIKAAMEVLTGVHKKKTEITIRSAVFKKLVAALEASGT